METRRESDVLEPSWRLANPWVGFIAMLFKLRRKNRSVDGITADLAGVRISPTVIYGVVPVLKNDR
jgi:hypothetical protein